MSRSPGSSGGAAAAADDRVALFVAHTFPPAGGSGAHRALAFARYLPARGWRPVVLTPGREWAAQRDDRLAADVPAELAVVRTPSLEPRPAPPHAATALAPVPGWPPAGSAPLDRLKRHLGHARRFPDAQAGWTPFAVAAGLRAVRRHRVRLIYSTAAPFTDHLVGLILHRLTRLPWVLELRDGWYRWNRAIFPDYPAWRGWLEGWLEGAAVRSASRVVLVTGLMAGAFRQQYPDLPPGHFVAIPNGFDPAQYGDLPAPAPTADRFEVLHAGALYHGRSVERFVDAAGRLAAADPAFAARFQLRLLGALDEGARAEVARQLGRHHLEGRVTYEGQLDHRSALEAMRRAGLLLLVTNTTPGAEATVPGKLFEYLAVGRPILAVTPAGAVGAAIVARTRSGRVACADDVDAIQAQLQAAFRAHQAGEPFAPDAAEVARYDRRALAGELADVFDDVLGHG